MLSKDEYLRRMRDPKWYGEQDENGVDLSLIRENLKLTPEERLLRADAARRSALQLQEIGRRNRGEASRGETESMAYNIPEIVALLAREGVEFIIIGGQAEALMGSPRVTYDVDLCYRRTPQNIQRLADTLNALNPRLRDAGDVPFVLDARAISQGNNFTLQTSLGSLDLIGWVEPLGEYDALARHADTLVFGGLLLKVISLDDLIFIKEHIRRPKDQESLFQLHAIRRQRDEKSGNQPS
jgi:hypothetical protein